MCAVYLLSCLHGDHGALLTDHLLSRHHNGHVAPVSSTDTPSDPFPHSVAPNFRYRCRTYYRLRRTGRAIAHVLVGAPWRLPLGLLRCNPPAAGARRVLYTQPCMHAILLTFARPALPGFRHVNMFALAGNTLSLPIVAFAFYNRQIFICK